MPGFILHQGASILCSHGGQAQPSVVSPRITVSGQPIVLQPNPHLVAGCPFNVSGSPSPCVTASWITGSVRVTSNGQPILLLDSQAICSPNGTPLIIASTQTRVIAT